MKIESEDIDVQNLLSRSYFHIPRFQRPYSWEAEHIIEFWNDLVENQGDEYFIGSMVLFRKGKQDFGVVDGQQRLTTITILLCAIRDALAQIGESEAAKGLHVLIENKNIENQDTYVLKTETSYPFFQDSIQKFGSPDLDLSPKPEEQYLGRAYEILKESVASLLLSVDIDQSIGYDKKNEEKVKKLKRVRDTVLGLKTIKITLGSEEDAYLIFETLNTRGKDLALSDLIKNHFSKNIPKKSDVDQVKEKWAQVLSTLQTSQVDLLPDTFLSHYWASRHETISQKKVFSSFKKIVKKANAAETLNAIVSDAKLYRMIYEPAFGWDKNERDVKNSLSALQLFRLSQPTPATLSLVRAYKNKKIKLKSLSRALEAIENFHFVFTAVTSSRSSGGISAMYSSFAQKIFALTDPNDLGVEIDGLVAKLKERRPSFSEFLVGFQEIAFTNSLTKQKSLVRYILRKLAQTQVFSFSVDLDDLSIEHIHPQEKIDANNWPDTVVGKLGNLTLISHETNGKLGNKPFAEKKLILINSGESFPQYIADKDEWTPASIDEHTHSLAELAYNKTWII